MKKLIIIIIFILIIVLLGGSITFIPSDYDRTIYSVIIHNNTKNEIDNISVVYGRSIEDKDTLFEFCRINDLKPDEYRKVNIHTNTPSEKAQVPYNVFVTFKHGDYETFSTAGYFGQGSGGISFLEFKNSENKLKLQRVYEHEWRYKKILRRHYKKQFEYCWRGQ